jgi:hypothetical protein
MTFLVLIKLLKFVVDILTYYAAPTGLVVIYIICYNHDVPSGLKTHYQNVSPKLKVHHHNVPAGLKKSAVGTS